MAYNSYGGPQYHDQQQHQYPQAPTYGAPYHTQQPTYSHPLKPIPQTTTTAAPSYAPVPTTYPCAADPTQARLSSSDAKNKRRIRILKALSRILATLLSLATFLPLAVTLVKFFQTRDETLIVDGEARTAWAAGTITWYTYLYFGVATISLLLNAAILISYCCGGVRSANATAKVEGWWANLERAVEVAVWIASVAIYRYGKEPDVEGKFKDLWGWTCSPAAREIQDQITNVDFDTYCNIQTTSFYTGILNVLASILTGAIYLYAVIRWRSKSKLRKATLRPEDAMEPLRP